MMREPNKSFSSCGRGRGDEEQEVGEASSFGGQVSDIHNINYMDRVVGRILRKQHSLDLTLKKYNTIIHEF